MTEEPTEVLKISRCEQNYLQKFSISNGYGNNFIHDTTIYFDQLKYSPEYGGDLLLYFDGNVIGRINMENKKVILDKDINLLELLASII